MATKKTRRKKPKKQTHTPPQRGDPAETGVEEGYLADWMNSRHGATAARGFHYQDAVGALIALRIGHGEVDGVLVPEGLDDMSVEGQASSNIQIKSRQLKLGGFQPAVAAGHVVDSWKRNQKTSTPAGTVVVVFENGVRSFELFDNPAQFLADALVPSSALDSALLKQVSAGKLSPKELDELREQTVVLSLSWEQADAQTDRILASLCSLTPAGRLVVGRMLRLEIADAIDKNASRDAGRQVTLDRTTVVNRINEVAEQIDVESLETALRTGLCVPYDRSVGAEDGDRFYEGEASQPGHVVTGLVVPRPDLLSEVFAAVEDGKPALITGPSGIGKSALLWSLVEVLRGVTWFRVNRVQTPADANEILRLARTYGASAAHPVGLLVDGAGAGQLTGWEYLRRHTATHDGVLLVSTARNEDLIRLGDLAETTTVGVALDEAAASVIYEGLRRRGVTEAPHWREAYEAAEGLTLEYTYILTQGRRLDEVIADQIRTRVRESRDQELDVLAVVAAAHQWSTTLRLEGVAESVGAKRPEFRQTMERLVDEHLLAEQDGVLSGLHPVRSRAIFDAVHSTPPPTATSTFVELLALVDDRQLPQLIVQALVDHPQLATTTINWAVHGQLSASCLAACLQGLRLADAERVIRTWLEIMDREHVKPALRETLIMLALAGMDMGDLTPAPMRRVLDLMAEVDPGQLRDELATRIGVDSISSLVLSSEPPVARELVATLHGWSERLRWPPSAGAEAPKLLESLRDASTETLAGVLGTMQEHDPGLWRAVVTALGGEQRMLERVRSDNPWLLELDIRPADNGLVAYARMLHIEDGSKGDSRQQCLAMARTLNRLLPSTDHPDVEVVAPGGHSLEIGGHVHGISRLQRQYDRDDAGISWVRARREMARSMLGQPDSLRLATGYPLMRDLASLVRELGNRWVQRDITKERARELSHESLRLKEAGLQISPSLGGAPEAAPSITDPGATKTKIVDPLSTTIGEFAELFVRIAKSDNHAGLAMHLHKTILPHVRECLDQPWHLIADGDAAVSAIRQLIDDATNIHDILVYLDLDGAEVDAVERSARRGSAKWALQRSADLSRRTHSAALEAARQDAADLVASVVPDCDIEVLVEEREEWTHFAVLIEGPSLFGWAEIESKVVEVLRERRRAMDQYLILPLRLGRPVTGFGIKLIDSPWPATDVGGWEGTLPTPHSGELASIVSAALNSLTSLSTLADLSEAQREHAQVEALADRANHQLSEAVEQLQRRDPDDFVQEALTGILQLATKVQEELTGEPERPTLAEAAALGVLGQITDEWNLILGLTLCAHEWEIDPDTVRALLGSE